VQIDPDTRALYADDGTFIKTLSCPLAKAWDQLTPAPGSAHCRCDACERSVLDTATLSDADVLAAVRADASTCLSVSAAQENVTLIWPTIWRGRAAGHRPAQTVGPPLHWPGCPDPSSPTAASTA
jgi:hypothetical protein